MLIVKKVSFNGATNGKGLTFTRKIFYSSSGDEDLTDSLQSEKVEIQNLIKQSLYPQGQEPVYYQGRYNNFKDLILSSSQNILNYKDS